MKQVQPRKGQRTVAHLDGNAPTIGAPAQRRGSDSVHDQLSYQTVTADLIREAVRAQERSVPTSGHVFPFRVRLLKRSLDIVVAASLFLALSPLILLAGLIVMATSKGPAIFSQTRVGRHGELFRMYKLRSMREHADDQQHREYVALFLRGKAPAHDGVFKLVRDPRITRAGRTLRRYSIDELPQLWNVLRGDMSLVGPRPALPHEAELYDQRARLRLAVQPGLTGLWQVSGRCSLSFAEMVELDVQYWQDWRLRSEVCILLKTPRAALSGRGAA